ncbi:MAG: AI-2E family transporter [Calditrichaeota bacterium]|nr:MAG: AI-2E family transporter [Calditrichota bacterium]
MESSVTRFLKIVLVVAALAGALWILSAIRSTIILLVIAALLAYILDPFASYLEFRGLSRTTATIVIFLLVGIVIFTVFYFLIPALSREITGLQKGLDGQSTSRLLNDVETYIKKAIPLLQDQDINLQGELQNIIKNIGETLFSLLVNLVPLISSVVIIPFAVFFLLKDGRDMKKQLVSMVPNRYFEMTLTLLHKIDEQLGSYLRGQFIDSTIIGLLAVTALWILDVPYYVLIGIFAGLANMIPYVGPFSGAIVAILTVLLNHGSGQDVLYVGLAFLFIQLIDNVVVQPMVLARSVNLHPLTIIFAIIIGGQFFGIIGMLVAVPTTGILKVLARESYTNARRFNLI